MTDIVFASSNKGKIKEITEILMPFRINIIPQSHFNVPDIEETGLSFVENAILKARNCCKHTGLPSLADDSGLCVNVINGAPGIYSARYAGNNSSSKENIDFLLKNISKFKGSQRSAYFKCIMVLLQSELDPTPVITEGSLHGQITESITGVNGFGYDPIFKPVNHTNTLAEITAEQKNLISHRFKALSLMKSKLLLIKQQQHG